jgi:hypothetical protein
MVCSAAVGSDVAQVNVEEWIRGVEMFGGEEEQQSSKKHEQDDGLVKDLFARPAGDDVQRGQRRANDVYTTGRHLGRLGAGQRGHYILQEQQKLQMQQAHAAEPDPLAASPRAAAMALLVCQLEESDWMVQNFLQAYHFQIPCLMC